MIYILQVIFPTSGDMLKDKEAEELETQINNDIEFIYTIQASLDKEVKDLIKTGLLNMSIEQSNPEKNKELKERYKQIIGQIIILESAIENYKFFFQIDRKKHPEIFDKAFILAYSSFIEKSKITTLLYRNIGDNDFIKSLLNEEIEGLGIKDSYLKLNTGLTSSENLIRAKSGRIYLQYIIISKEYKGTTEKLIIDSKDSYKQVYGNFEDKINNDIETALDFFETITLETWLPAQKEIANIFGETRLTHRDGYFITDEQIEKVVELSMPGDIMFQRRNWYMSNSGMPGFWTHAAIYTGTLEELDRYFENESRSLFNSTVSEYLKKNYPEVYADKIKPDKEGNMLRTIEGKAPGVIMLSMEESAYADYLAVIRPKLTKEDKLKSLIFAFENYKKPYDYDFDFRTDDKFVCSELVYKSYLPSLNKKGLNYSISMIAGRYMISPHDMVREFDERYDTDKRQNEFVLFLDGDEKTKKASFSGVEEFRDSWKRLKYDLFLIE